MSTVPVIVHQIIPNSKFFLFVFSVLKRRFFINIVLLMYIYYIFSTMFWEVCLYILLTSHTFWDLLTFRTLVGWGYSVSFLEVAVCVPDPKQLERIRILDLISVPYRSGSGSGCFPFSSMSGEHLSGKFLIYTKHTCCCITCFYLNSLR